MIKTALGEDIRRCILLNGPMDVGSYMSLCLSHPQRGYYMSRNPFGIEGDFTTAPEISQFFGEMIGGWVADLAAQIGGLETWHLVELGPGRGTLMSDIVRVLKKIPDLYRNVHLHLVETSPMLRGYQAQALDGTLTQWHDDLSTLPTQGPLFVIANEFFDALPVRQLIRRGNDVDEIVIGLTPDNQDLTFGRVPLMGGSASVMPKDMPSDVIYEFSPVRMGYAQDIFTRLGHQGGAALIIDYGYDTPIFTSTLQAVRAHEKISPLAAPGESDLTALVNFSELRACAHDLGMGAHGPIGQGDFLKALGIQNWADHVIGAADSRKRADLQAGLTRLLDPDQMGDLFRVLAVHAAAPNIFPAGFPT